MLVDLDLSFLAKFSDILTLTEAADILRITAEEMQHLIEEKNIPCMSIGGKSLILKSFFQNFLAELFKVDYTQNITAPIYCPSGDQPHLDNLIYEPSFGPHEKGTDDMAQKSKINQPVMINGEKRWITANTMQEFTDKVIKLMNTPKDTAKHDFAEYAWNWYNTYSKPTVETATATTYERQIRLHLIPAFQGLAVEDITTDTVQQLFNNMTGAKPTKNKARTVLNQILDSAVEDKMLTQNPLKSRRVKITGRSSKSTKPYSIEQMRYLVKHLNEIKNPVDREYMALQALHPLRLEEVLGLRPEDVDTENMVIYVRQAVTHPTRNQPEIKDTKTDGSYRTIGLSALALPHILSHSKGLFLFGGDSPLSYTQVRRMCERIKKDTAFSENITPIRFRTTVLTDLYDQTKDIKLAQAAAGHTTSAMTLKYYVKGRETTSRATAAVDQAYTD